MATAPPSPNTYFPVTIQSRVALDKFIVAWGFGRFAPEASVGMGRDSRNGLGLRN